MGLRYVFGFFEYQLLYFIVVVGDLILFLSIVFVRVASFPICVGVIRVHLDGVCKLPDGHDPIISFSILVTLVVVRTGVGRRGWLRRLSRSRPRGRCRSDHYHLGCRCRTWSKCWIRSIRRR